MVLVYTENSVQKAWRRRPWRSGEMQVGCVPKVSHCPTECPTKINTQQKQCIGCGIRHPYGAPTLSTKPMPHIKMAACTASCTFLLHSCIASVLHLVMVRKNQLLRRLRRRAVNAASISC